MSIAARIASSPTPDWDSNGWTLVPAFLDQQQLDLLRAEAERLWGDRELFDQRGAVPNSVPRSDRLDPVIDLSPTFTALARDPGLLAPVNSVLGSTALAAAGIGPLRPWPEALAERLSNVDQPVSNMEQKR